MTGIEDLLADGLPLNRKERFYTGTVLPAIICADRFSMFDRFTALIDGYVAQPLDWHPATANVQLFTEYSFVESVYGRSRARFLAGPTSKDTPDVMILIQGARRVLIAVEAKMFHNPLAEDIQRQMDAQALILIYLATELRLDAVHHVALLPEKLARRVGGFAFQTITWEQVHAAFATGREEDYWLALLRIALEQYDDLVSTGSMSTFGANNERKMSGAEIVALHRQGAGPKVMGRNRGLLGPVVEEDIRTGRWRTKMYETRAEGAPPNRNWFLVKDFVGMIDGRRT